MDRPFDWNSMLRYARTAVVLGVVSGVSISYSSAEPPTLPTEQDAIGGEAHIRSAFFGLDNGLPFRANRICMGASGKDGMPVVLSHTIDPETLQPEDFRVVTRAGVEHTPHCAALRPASDEGELRTVLLIGEFGDAAGDPPVRALVVGDLLSDGMSGEPVNFRGVESPVIPLDAGPTLVWAEVVTKKLWSIPGRGSACPMDSQQVVRATWSGGVRLPSGEDPGDSERVLYRVTVTYPGSPNKVIAPVALADLGDNDNNHLLCLDTTARVLAVGFPAGHLVDPNGDPNPSTQIKVGD